MHAYLAALVASDRLACFKAAVSDLEEALGGCRGRAERKQTLVTSLFDVGRAEWAEYSRDYGTYVGRLRRLVRTVAARPSNPGLLVIADRAAAAGARREAAQVEAVCVVEWAFAETPGRKCWHDLYAASVAAMRAPARAAVVAHGRALSELDTPEWNYEAYNEVTGTTV